MIGLVGRLWVDIAEARANHGYINVLKHLQASATSNSQVDNGYYGAH